MAAKASEQRETMAALQCESYPALTRQPTFHNPPNSFVSKLDTSMHYYGTITSVILTSDALVWACFRRSHCHRG